MTSKPEVVDKIKESIERIQKSKTQIPVDDFRIFYYEYSYDRYEIDALEELIKLL